MDNEFSIEPFFQALATVLIILGGSFLLFGSGPVNNNMDMTGHDSADLDQKIYVAVEGAGEVAVIDPRIDEVIKVIDLGGFSPHNIQVSPDNKTVWVTGNAAAHSHSGILINSANAQADESDEVIVIDPIRDVVIKRIGIKSGIHLAHVVLTPDSRYAYVTAQAEGMIYKIDTRAYDVVSNINTGEKSEPHGLRISPDGDYAYVAMLGNKSLGIIDLATDKFTEVPLGGAPVQTGVTPDNKYVVVSLYDTKQLAIYRIDDKSVSYIELPETAKGPIQMYSTPDSKFIYLADQGYYFGEPSSDWVYKIDVQFKKVVGEIKAGKAPHGVVVSADGNFVYVTNLLSDDVSVIDADTDEEIKRIKVGKEPNGISIWSR